MVGGWELDLERSKDLLRTEEALWVERDSRDGSRGGADQCGGFTPKIQSTVD